ncbi:putative RNA-dependent RNA polymerase 5 [Gossypium australe]|uniref:RNA-dependent RNA polymerase n=1 Tax=Gossypium australe TaxID=47621 RepID=A0A5B6UKU7_9ROSI|nr:putative RNA-dependent RNA polymerase 5 [Gossypium australe]
MFLLKKIENPILKFENFEAIRTVKSPPLNIFFRCCISSNIYFGLTMANNSHEDLVLLPQAVEALISRICNEQGQPRLGYLTRQALAEVGEEASLRILEKIQRTEIRTTFDRFVMFMIKNESNGNGSPQKRSNSSQKNSSPFSSPAKTCRFMMNSQGGDNVNREEGFRPQSVATPLLTSLTNVGREEVFSPQLVALGELEFRKAFLILSYIGQNKLEEVITADHIRSLKNLGINEFEREIWDSLGQCYARADRVKLLEREEKTNEYHCHVLENGTYRFKGPYFERTRSHLQRVLGDDNVLSVKFETEGKNPLDSGCMGFKKVAKEGILVGLRRYRFFVFKDGGKEAKKKDRSTSPVKCFFVRFESNAAIDDGKEYVLSGKTVQEARSVFMHVHTLPSMAKYMARFSLILSKTMKLEVDLSNLNFMVIEDIPCKDKDEKPVYKDGKLCIHSDGTGYISEDLALKCPKDVFKGSIMNGANVEIGPIGALLGESPDTMQADSYRRVPPLLIQIRFFYKGHAVKGTLLVNKKLPPRTIQVRPSMVKVEPDLNLSNICTRNSLEVVTTSIVVLIGYLSNTGFFFYSLSQHVEAGPKHLLELSFLFFILEIMPCELLMFLAAVLGDMIFVISCSNQPKRTSLSKTLIMLLSYGGVPDNFFMDLLKNALEESQVAFSNKRTALRVALNRGGLDELLAAKMILSGIPLDESYLQYRMSIMLNEDRKGLLSGKLPITDSYHLMGTVDPSGVLESDEVSIILDNGQTSGKVLVYRHPGVHFGDIHILTARYVKELDEYVGHAKYAIFFPSNGPRSLADEMAGGDFDGDMFFVSKNPQVDEGYRFLFFLQLLDYFKVSEPWTENCTTPEGPSRRPSEFSDEELESELFESFLKTRFQPSYAMSMAADNWSAIMDRFLTVEDSNSSEKTLMKENLKKLIDLYYEALDASKTGKKVKVPEELRVAVFPHYMERENSYKSTSILGKIYDHVKAYQEEVSRKEVRKLPCFNVEVSEECRSKWTALYEQYRKDMTDVLSSGNKEKNDAAANALYDEYKKFLVCVVSCLGQFKFGTFGFASWSFRVLSKVYGVGPVVELIIPPVLGLNDLVLYGGAELVERQRPTNQISEEALAIYNICYEYAIKKDDVGKCGFAWKVAGSALLNLHVLGLGEKTLSCAPSVLKELFS